MVSPVLGLLFTKIKKRAAVAVNAWDRVEVCDCRIRVTYTRPRRRGQDRWYYSNNMRCYQCGYNGHFAEIARELLLGEAIEERTVTDEIEEVLAATVENEMKGTVTTNRLRKKNVLQVLRNKVHREKLRPQKGLR